MTGKLIPLVTSVKQELTREELQQILREIEALEIMQASLDPRNNAIDQALHHRNMRRLEHLNRKLDATLKRGKSPEGPGAKIIPLRRA